jgi:hypothetical protein
MIFRSADATNEECHDLVADQIVDCGIDPGPPRRPDELHSHLSDPYLQDALDGGVLGDRIRDGTYLAPTPASDTA